MQAIIWTPGDEIRKARFLARMSQAKLALAVGVSRPLISKWERGLAEPTISQWRAIATATGVQLSVCMTTDSGNIAVGIGERKNLRGAAA